ncbi:MAG: DUF3253 domain-containing protein [Phenylobacterium sp.]|nr:DUF3253 domain-containing protein [Phenylobacterium sp.]MDP3855873.1 DUF3253 domain-containing protein [Phenylobacterium sp.]
MSVDMEAVILEILGKLPAGKSASSEEVARAADNENWRKLTGHVRNTARGLARQGRIVTPGTASQPIPRPSRASTGCASRCPAKPPHRKELTNDSLWLVPLALCA